MVKRNVFQKGVLVITAGALPILFSGCGGGQASYRDVPENPFVQKQSLDRNLASLSAIAYSDRGSRKLEYAKRDRYAAMATYRRAEKVAKRFCIKGRRDLLWECREFSHWESLFHKTGGDWVAFVSAAASNRSYWKAYLYGRSEIDRAAERMSRE